MPDKHFSLLITGMSGSGKTATALSLVNELCADGIPTTYISFDRLRKELVPAGVDAFSADRAVKEMIYRRAIDSFNELTSRTNAVIDSGISVEKNRRWIRDETGTKIIHVHAPLPVCVVRETRRSLREKGDRARFLYLRAYASLLMPRRYPQPGVTYPFEYPSCADLHVDSFRYNPEERAHRIRYWMHENNMAPVRYFSIAGTETRLKVPA
ncbi:MAG: adenylyl-sulfate kinase [Candidatus Aenigmarchaeota archaeon]|nr:adenylyl-sulfate kinase [Candidatus Aenigmarchaeota archaeon]